MLNFYNVKLRSHNFICGLVRFLCAYIWIESAKKGYLTWYKKMHAIRMLSSRILTVLILRRCKAINSFWHCVLLPRSKVMLISRRTHTLVVNTEALRSQNRFLFHFFYPSLSNCGKGGEDRRRREVWRGQVQNRKEDLGKKLTHSKE